MNIADRVSHVIQLQSGLTPAAVIIGGCHFNSAYIFFGVPVDISAHARLT